MELCQLSDPGPNRLSLNFLSLRLFVGALSCQVNNPTTLQEKQCSKALRLHGEGRIYS